MCEPGWRENDMCMFSDDQRNAQKNRGRRTHNDKKQWTKGKGTKYKTRITRDEEQRDDMKKPLYIKGRKTHKHVHVYIQMHKWNSHKTYTQTQVHKRTYKYKEKCM